MAENAVTPWRAQPMTLSLEQRVSSAKTILAQSSSPSHASKAAKQLVGSYAHLRPDNPTTFIESIAAVLAQYPPSVADECADPRRGIARKAEFLSVKAVVEWCEARLEYYQAIAAYRGPPPTRLQIEAGPVTAEDCGNLMAKVGEALRANNTRSPLDTLLKQVADARRLRIEEVMRTADAPCKADGGAS
jgi:hypothetical protein